MSREAGSPVENKRLDSWKEIAAFFGRDERTVKRWEKNRSLPVHRLPGNQRGGVFAYSQELTQWLNSTAEEKETAVSPPDSPAVLELEAEADQQPPETHVTPVVDVASLPPPLANHWKAIAAAGLALVMIIAALGTRHIRSRSPRAAPISTLTVSPVHAKAAPDHRAVEFYLKGRYYWNRRTGESLNRAVDSFTQAIVIDPYYAEAYAGLADTYNLLREYTSMPESEAYPRAIAAANKAVALDDSLAEAHRALAFALFNWKWEIPEAHEQYRRAIQLDPENADAHHWYATSLLSLGRNSEARVEIERARALSPTSPSILADRALIFYFAGERGAGIAALKEMEQTEPGFLSPPRYLSIIYLDQGDYPDFLEQQKRAAGLSKSLQEIATADAAKEGWQRGGERGMLEALANAQQQVFDKGQSSGYQLAHTCMLLGRKKDAVHYLQAAFAAHDGNVFGVPQGRFAESLKSDPDFEKLKLRILSYTGRKAGDPLPAQDE